MFKRWMVVAVLLMIAVGALVPGSPARAFQATAGSLGGMLAQVPDSAISRTVIWYGSLGGLKAILNVQLASQQDVQKLQRQQQLAFLLDAGKQIYYSPFSGIDRPAEWKKLFNVEPFSIDRELTVGTAPNWYGILQGQFDANSVAQALQNLGYKPSQVGGATLFSQGADNAANPNGQVNRLVSGNFNRILLTNQKIVAAPSTAAMQIATGGGAALGSDSAYAALVDALERPASIPGTQLLSAVLFSGGFLSDTVITDDPLKASVGKTLPADQIQQLRAQLGLENWKPLPRYQTAGFGYRRDSNNRYWVFALVYSDANTANQAKGVLDKQLRGYGSFQQNGRKLFDGWKIEVSVTPSQGSQVVLASMQLPQNTDLSWIDLVQTRDIGFLATTH
jgi:hypothetical protein